MQILKKIAWVLLIIGGLNRGLLGLVNLDVVAWIFGYGFLARLVYSLVGIATVYVLIMNRKK